MWYDELLDRLKKLGNGKAEKTKTRKPSQADKKERTEANKDQPATDVKSCEPKQEISGMPIRRKPTEEEYEGWRRMVWIVMEHMAKKTKEIPRTGRCEPYGLRFKLDGTQNIGCLLLESSARDQTQRTLTVRVSRAGSDLCVMHFVRTAPHEEIYTYLTDPNNVSELFDSLKELSSSVDGRY